MIADSKRNHSKVEEMSNFTESNKLIKNLNRGIQHFQVIKTKNKVENISELFRQRLTLIKVGFRVILTESSQKLGKALFQLLREVIELLQLLHSGQNCLPGLKGNFKKRIKKSLQNTPRLQSQDQG